MNELEKLLSFTKEVNGCLEWDRCLNTDGYARATINGNENTKVHRHVYQLCNPDEDIKGKLIRHTCDNTKCINPAHLLSGSPKDNVMDKFFRERSNVAKLTPEQVRELRRLHATGKYLQRELGSMFNINYRTVSYIVKRKTYAWVS